MAKKTVWLSAQPTGTVTVDLVPSHGADAAVGVSPARLTFNGSNWSKGQHVLVSAVQDNNTRAGDVPVTLTARGGGYDNVSTTMNVTVVETTHAGVNKPRGDPRAPYRCRL